MPTPLIEAVARRQNKPVSEIEAKWEEAKQRAAAEGHAKDWPYVVSVFKKLTHYK